MNTILDSGVVMVTLSRRNLRDLLANPHGANIYSTKAGITTVVTVEDDHLHYNNRQPGPGISADRQE